VNLASQQTQQRFPFPYDDVFSGLVAVLPEVGMTVKSQDKVIGRVTASAGMSLFSWGESIAIVVQPLDDKATIVGIESSLKFGANVAGAHRHQKNFESIIAKLSAHLQRHQRTR
jgi:flavin reductase (DIM6/NTAB) family NADH-FMN oxidoreductase RutF